MANASRLLREDELVANVVRDPREPPDTLFVTGFVGRAVEPGFTRVYLDVQLAVHIEVPSDEVLHAEPLPRSQSLLGGHHLWVLRTSPTLEKWRDANRRLTQMQQEAAMELQLAGGGLGGLPSGWPSAPGAS